MFEKKNTAMDAIPYTIQYLSTAVLVSGLPYQRMPEDKDIDKLIQNWDGRLLEPLTVSFRNGRHFLVDGQHRIVVLRRMNGGKDLMVPCKVYRGLTYEMEAEGDASGDLKLNNGLTRAELAATLTRLNDEVTDPSAFEAFCYFQDVPSWAKPYVGYTVSWLLMRGYNSTHFGPNDAVNPQMACTVVLRSCGYDSGEVKDWTYATAGQYAASLGWIDLSTAKASTITRGDMAVLLCRASGWLETGKQESL